MFPALTASVLLFSTKWLISGARASEPTHVRHAFAPHGGEVCWLSGSSGAVCSVVWKDGVSVPGGLALLWRRPSCGPAADLCDSVGGGTADGQRAGQRRGKLTRRRPVTGDPTHHAPTTYHVGELSG